MLTKILAGKPEGKKPFGRPRPRWENNVKMGLRETGFEGGSVQAPVAGSSEHGNEPSGS
jgi:hypothetical protein